MQTVTPFSIRRVRFRRWNRHSYSTFCSIGRCINIGCVRKEIADQSLRKGLLLLAPHGYNLSRKRREDEALPGDASPELHLVPAWATTWTIASETTAPCGPRATTVRIYHAANYIPVQRPPRLYRFFYTQIPTLKLYVYDR